MALGGLNGGRSLGQASGSIIINTDSLGRAEVTARRVGQNVNRELKGLAGGAKQAQVGLQAMGRAMSGVAGMGKQLASALAGMGKLLASVLAGLRLRAIVRQFAGAVSAASELQETISKTSQVFRENAADILAWSKDSATAFGLSQQAALEAASTVGNMFDQLGAGSSEAARLSKQMVGLAADIASFHNVSGGATEVLVAMQSAFRGEYDALQRYIPTITAAAVEQQALADTGKENAKQLTALDKAYAAQAIIIRGAGAALGDFERTSMDAANQQRILGAQLSTVATTVGSVFLPVYREVLRTLNQIVADVAPYAENIMASFAGGLARAINTYVVPALMLMRSIFTTLLEAHSPPKLLPDLDKWGEAAMQAYLQGWTNADFSVFDTLARQLEGVIRSFAGAGAIPETDLVTRVFGTRAAIMQAVSEFSRAGRVGQSTLAEIQRAAGPAGAAVAGLVSVYFELETAGRAAARAQDELTEVTRRYDAVLSPLQDKLDAVQNQQADIRDQQRAAELNAEIADINTTASDRRLAQLELEEIELRRQQRLLEEERDTAVDAAQAKVDAAQEEEAARREAYDTQQAVIEQQVATNRLIEEEASLRERLAAESLAKQEQALRELEQAQRELERAEGERQRELERIYQAQLAYNMQMADTPGKIALLKRELGRYTEGSAEYYDILTQIAALEQSLAREREAAAGAGGAGMFGGLEEAADTAEKAKGVAAEMTKAAKDLAQAWRNAWNAVTGQEDELGPGQIDQGLSAPAQRKGQAGLPAWLENILRIIKDVKAEFESFKISINGWSPDLTGLHQLGEEFAFLLAVLRGNWTATHEGMETQTKGSFNIIRFVVGNALQSLLQLFSSELTALNNALLAGWFLIKTVWESSLLVMAGEWEGAWESIKENMGLALTALGRVLLGQLTLFAGLIDTWFGLAPGTVKTHLDSATQAVVNWGVGLWDAGYNAVANLFRGIKTYWDTIVAPWWQNDALGRLADLLPGSEPKDSSSPLRGLGDRGAAIVDNIMAGMDKRALTVSPTVAGSLAGAGVAQAITNHNYYFDQQFNATPEFGLARQASREGVLAAMRARGA